MKKVLLALALIVVVVSAGLWWRASQTGDVVADGLPTLEVTVFAAPSQSVWFPTIIQKTGLDVKNGFHLVVKQKPGPVAYAEFASGVDKVCYCAGTAAVARFVEQGSPITLLWNVFATDYVLVTNNPAVRRPTDIIGRRLAADTGAGSYAIAAVLLKQAGVDVKKVEVQSARGAAQAAQLSTHRVDAVLMTPIESSLLQADDPEATRVIPLIDDAGWKRLGYDRAVPHISFGVWREWIADPAHADLARRFYRANVEAVDLAKADPERAATIVSSNVDVRRESVLNALRSNAIQIRVAPISEYRDAIRRLTTQLLPQAGMLDRPLNEAELAALVSDFRP